MHLFGSKEHPEEGELVQVCMCAHACVQLTAEFAARGTLIPHYNVHHLHAEAQLPALAHSRFQRPPCGDERRFSIRKRMKIGESIIILERIMEIHSWGNMTGNMTGFICLKRLREKKLFNTYKMMLWTYIEC
ncbi:hypothetical protein llap_19674 [Limosa lapponica baueri]|uniref:Uncharacterized protein n=1 Tax=Limosa lapponica baueri TaxID=1758121 RepID=A0A2I0T899_LIMLA|nr:hypothetical protein llap_19674 [Limosa lapponica baueri]